MSSKPQYAIRNVQSPLPAPRLRALDRRDFIKWSAAGLMLAASPLRLTAAPGPPQPNLLVIHCDEFNFRMLQCYRDLLPHDAACIWGEGAVPQTPNIDALAARGAVCSRYYAASPVCTPSRASFISGRYPQNTGADKNDKPLRDDVVSFAEVLRRNGYATGYAGKWHLDGQAWPGWTPRRQFGFEDNLYMFNRGHWKQLEDTPAGPAVKTKGPQGNPNYSVVGADEKSFTTDFLARKTIDFIKAHRDKPFCYMVSIPDPHDPNTVRAPYDTMYQNLKITAPPTFGIDARGQAAWAQPQVKQFRVPPMAHYFGMVKCIDDNVGKIIDALRATGQLERTVIVFTADHGDMCGEHGRMNKSVPFESSARIPCIICYPGKIKPGSVVPQTLSNVDFKPTILGLLGFQSPDRPEGRDASPWLRGAPAPAGWQDVVFVRHAEGEWIMAVGGPNKLIFSTDADPCLYDLAKDPLETKNVFRDPDRRAVVRDLARALLDHGRQAGEPLIQDAALAADLRWAAEGSGPYAPPKRTVAPAGAGVDRADE